MSSTPTSFVWTPPLKRKVAALHLGLLALAGLFWSSGAWLSGGYRIELTEALIVAGIPALPIRCISIWLATLWTRRAVARGAADSMRQFACADVLMTLALGMAAMPMILLAYFVFAGVAWTLLFPVAPTITAYFLMRQGFLVSGSGRTPEPAQEADPGLDRKLDSDGSDSVAA